MTTASRASAFAAPAGRGGRFVGHVLLLCAKLALAAQFGSLAFAADALGSAAVLGSGLSAVVLARWSDPRPDRDHPYGHAKVQALASLGISVVLVWALLELGQASVLQLWHGAALRPPSSDGGLLLLVPLAVGQVVLVGGRRTLAWTTAVASAALLLASNPASMWLDPAAAVLIAVVVLRDRGQALRQQLPWLLDQIALAPEAIHRVAMEVPGVLNCHDIASRGVRGQQIFIDMHMVVDATDLPTAHRITELVEDRLDAQFGPVRCTIHLEPREYASSAITFKGAHG